MNEVKKNSVSKENIDHFIDTALQQEVTFWGKEVVVSYRLYNGFTILGRGACVDPANFDLEIGRKVAREQAINKLWELEGYLLQNKLYENNFKKVSEEQEEEIDKTLGLESLTFRLHLDNIEKLKRLAKEQGIITKALIRRIIENYIKESGIE